MLDVKGNCKLKGRGSFFSCFSFFKCIKILFKSFLSSRSADAARRQPSFGGVEMKIPGQICNSVLIVLAVLLITSCNSSKSSHVLVGNLSPANNDEAEIFLMVQNVQDYISASQWDEWLSMYSDDAVLTSGKGEVTKDEMRKNVEGASYKITDMRLVDKQINTADAFVSVSMMGNGKKQLETYHFRKIDGRWLIVKETNP